MNLPYTNYIGEHHSFCSGMRFTLSTAARNNVAQDGAVVGRSSNSAEEMLSTLSICCIFVHVWLLLSCDKFIERKETAIKPRGSKL